MNKLNENNFDFLVSQKTMNKAKKLLSEIEREYMILRKKDDGYLFNIRDIKVSNGWKKVWDNRNQMAYVYDNFIFLTYHSRQYTHIDVFTDIVYTQADNGEWIKIDFNDYTTSPLEKVDKENLQVILNNLKKL